MRFDHKKSLFFSGVVFVVLFVSGLLLSQHKLLWVDECFTQHVSIDAPSYIDIITLRFPDGNRSPLFYILQKINCDVFGFHYSGMPAENNHDVSDLRSQIIIRIPSDLYMSLALACIFYYFIRFYSLLAAFYALAVALVTPMVWIYWVEARPYSLWFLLTTAQLLLYCSKVRLANIKSFRSINVIHFLLVLTTPGSILQVFIVSLMLFLKKGYHKRQLLWTFIFPLFVFLIYYFLIPVYKFKTFDFLSCLFEIVMPERLVVYVIYGLTAWGLSKEKRDDSRNTFFFPVFLLFLLSAVLVLFIHLFTDQFQFGLFSRYLIYLVPADILMFSLVGFDLWHWSRKYIWVRMNIVILLGGLMILRAMMTYRDLLSTALFMHSPG